MVVWLVANPYPHTEVTGGLFASPLYEACQYPNPVESSHEKFLEAGAMPFATVTVPASWPPREHKESE
jgi:hypothetical protein